MLLEKQRSRTEVRGTAAKKESIVNKDRVIGKLKEMKGKIKQEVGHATGQTETEAQGLSERIGGKIQTGVGKAKDAIKRGVDRLLATK